MRRLSRTVPANYIRLDDSVTSADRFINQRDMQIARLNHNKLVGFTGARCAYHCQFGASNIYFASFVNPEMTGVSDAITTPPIIRARVLLTPHMRKLSANVYGATTKTAGMRLYFVLSHPGVERQIRDSESILFASTTAANSTCDVTIPAGGIRRRQWIEFDLAVYVNAASYGAVLHATVAIVSATTTSVTVATASISGAVQRGDLIHFDTAAGVQPYPGPRVITSTSVSGANTTLHVLWPWAVDVPVAGTHRVTVVAMSALLLERISLLEVPMDDFDSYRGSYA